MNLLAVFLILTPGFVIRISWRPCLAHLQELASHVHAYEIFFPFVVQEHFVNLVGSTARKLWRLKFPVGQNLIFIRFYEENPLFPSPDAVQLRVFPKIDLTEIKRIIEGHRNECFLELFTFSFDGLYHLACFFHHLALTLKSQHLYCLIQTDPSRLLDFMIMIQNIPALVFQ